MCRIVPGIPIFEISVKNADKPSLSIDQIKSRLPQFEKEGTLSVLHDFYLMQYNLHYLGIIPVEQQF
jgi:hypothetical protein